MSYVPPKVWEDFFFFKKKNVFSQQFRTRLQSVKKYSGTTKKPFTISKAKT